MSLAVHTHGGTVAWPTTAGHLVKHAGKGKGRQVVCTRCDARAWPATPEDLAAFVRAHGEAVCP